jgi:NitT/TauT family transport system permease protein
LWKITLPASMPYVLAGIRLSVGLAIIGMVVAEFFTAITGLGGLIVFFANSFATAKLFVPIIVIGLLGIVTSEMISMLERDLLAWRDSEKRRN